MLHQSLNFEPRLWFKHKTSNPWFWYCGKFKKEKLLLCSRNKLKWTYHTQHIFSLIFNLRNMSFSHNLINFYWMSYLFNYLAIQWIIPLMHSYHYLNFRKTLSTHSLTLSPAEVFLWTHHVHYCLYPFTINTFSFLHAILVSKL